jgi:hypothetical protein
VGEGECTMTKHVSILEREAYLVPPPLINRSTNRYPHSKNIGNKNIIKLFKLVL